jgi:hypothetical protein
MSEAQSVVIVTEAPVRFLPACLPGSRRRSRSPSRSEQLPPGAEAMHLATGSEVRVPPDSSQDARYRLAADFMMYPI